MSGRQQAPSCPHVPGLRASAIPAAPSGQALSPLHVEGNGRSAEIKYLPKLMATVSGRRSQLSSHLKGQICMSLTHSANVEGVK